MFVQRNAPLARGQIQPHGRSGLLRDMRFGGRLAHLGVVWLRPGSLDCSETASAEKMEALLDVWTMGGPDQAKAIDETRVGADRSQGASRSQREKQRRRMGRALNHASARPLQAEATVLERGPPPRKEGPGASPAATLGSSCPEGSKDPQRHSDGPAEREAASGVVVAGCDQPGGTDLPLSPSEAPYPEGSRAPSRYVGARTP